MKECTDYSLRWHNTFGIDVKARRFVEYDTVSELQNIIPTLKAPFIHIGSGSNLLFTKDYEGTVLHGCITDPPTLVSDTDEQDILVRAGAGMIWDNFVEYCINHDWYGTENLSLIPGEVGAAAVQNIGAYGVEAKDLIHEVELVDLNDGSHHVMANEQCRYAYRQSIFKSELKGKFAVTHVTFRLQRNFTPKLDYGGIRSALQGICNPTAKEVRQAIISIRTQKLPEPRVLGNAGSFFMNPVVPAKKAESIRADYPNMPSYDVSGGVKIPAGWLIEQCGWKGKALGKAGVYEKQALVLVNLGGATGEEVLRLCEAVCKDVYERFGVTIKPEVNIL